MSPLSAIPAYASGLTSQIERLPASTETISPTTLPSAQPIDSSSFSSLLGKLVSDVNAQQQTSNQSVSALQGGANELGKLGFRLSNTDGHVDGFRLAPQLWRCQIGKIRGRKAGRWEN